jgi:hypothetical protein
MQEHLMEQLSGMYAIPDPVSLGHRKLEYLWKGMYWSDHEANLGVFALRLPKLAPDLVRFVRMIRFYIAPVKLSRRLLERSEAAIAKHFLSRPSIYKKFFEGKPYRPLRKNENPVRLRCLWPTRIDGAPRNLEV